MALVADSSTAPRGVTAFAAMRDHNLPFAVSTSRCFRRSLHDTACSNDDCPGTGGHVRKSIAWDYSVSSLQYGCHRRHLEERFQFVISIQRMHGDFVVHSLNPNGQTRAMLCSDLQVLVSVTGLIILNHDMGNTVSLVQHNTWYATHGRRHESVAATPKRDTA